MSNDQHAPSKWRAAIMGDLTGSQPMTEESTRKFLIGMLEDNERLEAENDQSRAERPRMQAVAAAAQRHVEAIKKHAGQLVGRWFGEEIDDVVASVGELESSVAALNAPIERIVFQGSPRSDDPPPVLRIRPVPWADRVPSGVEQWLYLDHGGGDFTNYDLRWAIERRTMPTGDWWGVVALSPHTHRRALGWVAREMQLADQAIEILQMQARRGQGTAR